MDPRNRTLTVCVLGGTGFVGTELVTRLVGEGHWVRVPTRQLANGDHLRVLDTVELVLANVFDPRVLGQLFQGVDVIINLIGTLNEHGRAARFHEVHAELAAKVTAAARTARVRRLLHMSSLGADPERAPSKYLRSKGQAEAHVRAAAAWLDFTIFRPSVIFGPGDSLTNRFARLLRLSAGFLPLARPHARFAPIAVYDVADAFLRALHQRETVRQTYELCGPDIMTLEQIVRMTAEVAGLPCRIIRLPDAVARLQALVMNFVPGKPFSIDNYKSLTIDSVCSEDGCGRLGITPQHMIGVLPTYLGNDTTPAQLDFYRKTTDR
jgi:NADH dehydrogenase